MGTFPISFFETVFADEEYKNDIYVDPYPDIEIMDPDNYDPTMSYPPKPDYSLFPPSQVAGLRTDEIVNVVVVGYTDTKYITRNIDQNMETVKMQTHIPYVDSLYGMVPYVMEETPESILVTVAGGQFDFNKIFGDVSVREGAWYVRSADTYQYGDQIIVSDSYVVRMAEMGSDVWSVMDINNAPLTVTTDTRETNYGTQFVVIYTRTNAEGVFETEYKVTGGELKATVTFTNNQYTNHKFAFTETIILDDNLIELNEQTIDLNQFVGQSFDRATLEENRDIVLEVKNLYYNAGLGMENLWAVHIHADNKISLDYANDYQGTEIQTGIGESISLDPTITLTELGTTHCIAVRNQSPYNAHKKYCTGGSGFYGNYFWQWDSTAQGASHSRIDRFGSFWDITTVPSTATVTNINLKANQFGYGNYGADDSGNCELYQISGGDIGQTNTTGQTALNLYSDLVSGNSYGTISGSVQDSSTGDEIGCNHPIASNWGGPTGANSIHELGGLASEGHATDGWDGFNALAISDLNTAIANGDSYWGFGINKDMSGQTTQIKGHWWNAASVTLTYVAPSTASAPTWDIRDVDGNTDAVGGLADYSGWEHKQAIKINAVEVGDVLHSAIVPLGIFQASASGNVWVEVISGTATFGNDNPTANIRATSNLVDVTTLSDCGNTSSTSCLADVTFTFATAETLQEHDYIAVTTDASSSGWQNSHVAIGQITSPPEARYYMNQGSGSWANSGNNISMKLNTTPIVDNFPNISLAWHNTDDASVNPAVTGWKVERSLIGDKSPDTEDTFNTDNFADVGTQVQVIAPAQTYTAPAVPATRNYWMDAGVRDGFGIKINNSHVLAGETVTEVSFWVSRDQATTSATYEIYAENNGSVLQNSFCSSQPVQDLTYTTLTDGSGETKITCDTGSWDVNSNGGNDILWITTNASNEEMLIAVDDGGANANEDTYINRNLYNGYPNTGVKWEAKYGGAGAGQTVGALNWNADTNANDQASTLDLGTALSDTDWILRFKFDVTNIDVAGSVYSEHMFFRMTDTVTTDYSGNADYVSFSVVRLQPSTVSWGVNAVDNSTELASGCTTCFGTLFVEDTYWIEMSRDGDEFTIKQYSDAEYTDLVQTVTETQASVTGLRYFQGVVFTNQYADRTGNISGTLDDLQIWDAPSGTLYTYAWETATADSGSTVTSYTDNFPSRLAGSDYTWRVSAINSLGTSAASPSSDPLTLLGLPQAPTSVTPSNPELNQMNVGWAEVTGQYALSQGTTLLDTDFSSDAGWLDGGTKGDCANDATCAYKIDTEIDTTAEVLIWDGTRTDLQTTCDWSNNYDFDQCDGGNSVSFDLGQDLSDTWVAEFDLKINDNDQTTCNDVSSGYHGCYTSKIAFMISNQDASYPSFYVESAYNPPSSGTVGWEPETARDFVGVVMNARGDGSALYSKFAINDNNVDNATYTASGCATYTCFIEFWDDTNLTNTNYSNPIGPPYNQNFWDNETNDTTAGNECGSGTNADPSSSYCTGDEFRIKIIRDGYDTYLKIYDLGSGALLYDLSNTIEQTGTNASGRHQDMRYFNVQSYGCDAKGVDPYPSSVPQYCDQRGSFHGEIDNLIVVDGATSAGVSYHDADGGSDILGYKIFDSKDNSSYTIIDSFYTSLDGTNNGALSGATGHIDTYSWDFDGVDDYVEVKSSSLSALDGLTVSAWVYPHTATSGHIAGVDESGGLSWNLELINGIPSFKVYDSASYYVTQSANALTLNTWNHVLGTFDGATTTNTVYVNSVQEGAPNTLSTSNTLPSGDVMRIGGGGYSGGATYFDGLIDQVTIYDKALVQSAIDNLYNNGIGVVTPSTINLIYHADFEDLGDTSTTTVNMLPAYSDTVRDNGNNDLCDGDSVGAYTVGTGRIFSSISNIGNVSTDCFMWMQDYDISSLPSATITDITYNFQGDSSINNNYYEGTTPYNNINYVPLESVRANAPVADVFAQIIGVVSADAFVLDSTVGHQSQYPNWLALDLGTNADTTLTDAIANGDSHWGFGSQLIYNNGGDPFDANQIYGWYILGGFNIDVSYNTVANAETLDNHAFFVDTHLDENDDYYHKVSAITAVGEGAASTASTPIPTKPLPPTVTAVSASDVAIDINWTNPTGAAESGFKIEKSTDAGTTWTDLVADTANTNLTYQDVGLQQSTTYYYRISTINPSGTSASSNESFSLTFGAPDAPTTLTAVAEESVIIKLDWIAGADNGGAITGYKIETSTDAGATWQVLVPDTGNTNITYDDGVSNSLTIGNTYHYRTSAINAYGTSPVSNVANALAGDAPAQAIISTMTALAGLAIRLDWAHQADNSYSLSSYLVEYSTDSGSSWASAPSGLLAGTLTTFTHSSLTEGTNYQYRLTVSNALGDAPVSTATGNKVAGDIPDAPVSLTSALQASPFAVNLSWQVPPDDHEYAVDEYRVYRESGNLRTLLTSGITVLTYSDTTIVGGTTYDYTVQAHNALGWSVDSNTTTIQAGTVPDAPINLTATAVADYDADLAWTAGYDGGLAISGYKIEHSSDGSNWTTLVADTGNANTTYTADYTSAESGNTKYWKVSAINTMGTGVASSSANVKLGDVPSIVTGVTATPQSSTEIDLAWSIPSDNGYAITVYKVERSLDGSTNWAVLTSTETGTTYSDTGLIANTDYYYRISASNALGIGTPSTNVQAKTFGVPSDIDDLALTVVSTTQINLAWTEPALNGYTIVEYEIFRSEDGTNYTSIATQTGTSYSDTGLNVNDLYYYKVTTTNTFGTSGDSNIESDVTLPTPPATITLTVNSDTEIVVQWNTPAGDQQTSYKIEMSLDGTNWTDEVASTGNTNTNYTDTGLTGNTEYHYRVSTINASGTSSASTSASETTFGVPESPTGLTATSLIGAEIKLDWVAPTDNNGSAVSGYMIERSTDNVTFSVLVADTTSTAVTYTDSGLTTGTTYYYKISAINQYGTGTASGVASALASDVPAQVANLTATAQAGKEIDLAWTAPNNGGSAITGYQIERSTDGGTTYTDLVANTNTPTTSYTDINLTAGTTYYYKISAINFVGTGATSTPANALAGDRPDQITVISATALVGSEIIVNWTAPADNSYAITSYLIQSSTDQQTWSTAGSSTTTSFTDTSLAIGSTYYYRVHATNALGDSDKSGIVNDLAGDVPAQTTGLTTTVLSDTSIRLNWSAPVDNAYSISGYKIERSPDNVTFTVIVANTSSTAVVHTDTGLTAQTDYYYKISAINSLGTGTASTAVLGTTWDVPDAIADLSGVVSGDDIDFTWSAPADNGATISKYIFQVQSVDTGNWITLNNNIQGLTTTHSGINAAIPNEQISYRVYAVNAVGQSPASNIEAVWTLPTAPTGVTVTAISDTEIDVTWTTITGLTYKLEHSTDNVTYGTESDPATTPYNDTGLTLGTIHYYKVYAVNPSGTSPASTIVSATTFYYPTPPLNVAVNSGATLLDATITWSAPSDSGGTPITEYKIERSITSASSGFNPITPTPFSPTTLTYDDTGLAQQTQYWYKILAVNSVGADQVNGYSAVVTYTTPTPPNAPSNLVIEPLGINNNSAKLDWVAPTNTGSHAISGYKIERNINGAGWVTATTTTNSLTSITDTNLIVGNIYDYRVFAITQAGISANPSNMASIEMLDITFTLTAGAIGGNTIEIITTVTFNNGTPFPTLEKIRIYENSGSAQVHDMSEYFNSHGVVWTATYYEYPTTESSYFAVVTLNNGATTTWQSNTVVVTPASPFAGELEFEELRDSSSNWSESDLDLSIQPAGSDIIVKYQPEGNVKLNTVTGVCEANCPILRGYENVQQAITATTTNLEPNKNYYISIYVQPQWTNSANEVTYGANAGDPVVIVCTSESSGNCMEGDIPKAYPSNVAIKSPKSEFAPPSLGIDQLGNIFGLPLVFIFVIGIAAIFTGRSAQMGILFIAVTLGIMAYLGYLSFDFDPENNSNIVTWTLIIIVAILGAFIGKRWS